MQIPIQPLTPTTSDPDLPNFVDQMTVVTTKETSARNPQVNQDLISKCLVAKDHLDEVELESRFHFNKHLDYPNIHTVTLFKADTLGNATNLQFGILDDMADVLRPADSVVLPFLTVQKEAVSKT
jgi:hypothetical protein